MSLNRLSEKGGLPTFVVILLAALLIFASVVAGYFLGGSGKNKQTQKIDTLENTTANTQVDTSTSGNTTETPVSAATSTSLNISASFENKIFTTQDFSFDLSPYYIQNSVVVSSTKIQYISLPQGIADQIHWIGFYNIDQLGFFDVEHRAAIDSSDGGDNLKATTYYVGGWFEHDSKKGLIVFADVDCLDCMYGGAEPYSMFVLYDNQIVLLEKLMYTDQATFSSLAPPLEHIVNGRVLVDRGPVIPYLEFPDVLYVKGNKLEFVSNESASDSAGKLSKDEDIWQKMNKVGADPVFGDVYLGTGIGTQASFYQNFYILGRDHRVRTYDYKPSLVNKDGLIDVVYNDGVKVSGYRFTHAGGCGRPAIHVILPGEINIANDLTEVGKSSGGVKLLGLKDDNHKLLKEFYNWIFYPEQGNNLSYDDFIKARPAVFWVDPFGRLIMFELDKFQPAAECGKPVIYLYPEKETKVKVGLKVDHFSYTEPVYGNGWEVVAKPNGDLVNLADKKNYPYLYWEGVGVGEQPEAVSGFVVAREEVDKFLNEKLVQLGLQGREVSDFIEFWQPRMTKAPYYFVTFYGTSVMNRIAPLTIDPKPDTTIRVLMDYRPLNNSITVKEQKLSHPARRGFTAIEWGGVLGRE